MVEGRGQFQHHASTHTSHLLQLNGQVGWFPSNYVEETASYPSTVLTSNGYNANGGNGSAYPASNGGSAFTGASYPAPTSYDQVLEVATFLRCKGLNAILFRPSSRCTPSTRRMRKSSPSRKAKRWTSWSIRPTTPNGGERGMRVVKPGSCRPTISRCDPKKAE